MKKEINDILLRMQNNRIDVGEAANLLLGLFNNSHSALIEDLKVTNRLCEERQRLLDAIPECNIHGKCVPHALEWIERGKWISVKDKLPPLGEFEDVSVYVLVTDGNMAGYGHYNYDSKDWYYRMPGYIEQSDNAITHWMPLPEQPKD